jgi:hypothetical protein
LPFASRSTLLFQNREAQSEILEEKPPLPFN